MMQDRVQPPRYTSTPLAHRKTSNILNSFIEVSPIYPTPEKSKKVKSMIPVSKSNEIRPRSNGIRSTGIKTMSMSTNSTADPTRNSKKTQVPRELQEEKPQNSVDKVSTKSTTQTKPQVPWEASAKEPRNSVDEVIDSVIRSLSRNEIRTSPRKSDAQDVPQSVSCRMSKISQRPSTLPSVPEEAAIEGTSQLSQDCIFKRSETQNGWQIPKETKSRVSLKKKSTVPLVVTKRMKKIKSDIKQDDESLFHSPELPNLVEVSSLCKKRQTYVLKKKPEITDIQEERHESVIDGIIPLEILSQKSPLINVSVKSTQGNSKEILKETIIRKNNAMGEQTAPKNKSEERNGGKENIEQYVSPNVKVYKNKRKLSNQPENQLKECAGIESSNSKPESLVKNIIKDMKPIEPNKELCQERNIREQSSKELGVDIIAHQSKETKKKNIKSMKKETHLSQDQDTESLKSDIGRRRTLRERKPNLQYVDTSKINGNDTKDMDNKKKKVSTVKSSQEQKENSYEPPLERKSQKKKTVKGNKQPSSVNLVPNEVVLQQHAKGPEDTHGVKTLNSQTNLKKEICSEKQEEITVPKKANKEDKCTNKNNKKGTENKKQIKKVAKTNPEIPVEESKELINHANLHKERDIQQNTSKKDVAFVATASNAKQKARKLNSRANEDANQINEANAESQNAGALIDNEHLKLVLHGTSSLKPTSNNKTRPGLSPEIKNICETVCKNSSVKHANDDNPSMKPAEEDADNNSQSTKGKMSKQFVEEKEKITRKTILNKHSSKGQSRAKPKNGDVCEHAMADKTNKLPEDENCPEAECCVSSGKKRKSEDMECGASHSASESAVKRRKYDDSNSGKDKNSEGGYSIKDLLGMREVSTHELQPGVVATRSIYINNFVMMGDVRLEPGATLSKISSNTAYTVREGTACVTIKKHTKYFNASDAHPRFFIPKNIDVSITNAGNLPLKMDFVKFKG